MIRPAEPPTWRRSQSIVERAYGVYVERIGMRPGPMDDDYAEQVRRGLVHVAEDDGGEVVGLIVLVERRRPAGDRERRRRPRPPGRGDRPRACSSSPRRRRARAGIDTVALYTHEKMSENLALYARLGYEEDERRRVSRLLARLPRASRS